MGIESESFGSLHLIFFDEDVTTFTHSGSHLHHRDLRHIFCRTAARENNSSLEGSATAAEIKIAHRK